MLSIKNKYWQHFFAALLLFISFFVHAQEHNYQQLTAFENHVITICQNVEKNKNTTAHLTPIDFGSLPIGITPKITEGTAIIVIDSAYASEQGKWFLSAYASIFFPGTNKPIAFAASHIGFNESGLIASSGIRLMLLSEQSIAINENLKLVLPADGNNFIEFDCDGFKSVNLKGNFIFSNNLLLPENDEAPQAKEVVASFEINTADLNNIMASVNITPFKIRGLDDFSFSVNDAVVDYSDIINPEGFSFPADYQNTFGEEIMLWRGFYLRDVKIRIKGFSGDSSVTNPTLQAHNLIVDDFGVSGTFSASNLMSLSQGSADGWPLSVNNISATLLLNKLKGGTLDGEILVPFLGDKPIAYAARMEQFDNELNYHFSMATGKDKVFHTPLKAKITIEEGSIISLSRQDGKLIPSALLNGTMSLNESNLTATGLRFEGLGLTTQAPYIYSGTFSQTGDTQSRSVGFPISIDSVAMKVAQGKVALGLGVSLNFMNKEDKGFSASTYIQVLASLHQQQNELSPNDLAGKPVIKQKWEFDKVTINDISLTCNTGPILFSGRLSVFQDHPTYGNGFHGNINFSIKEILERPIKVNAYFGSVEDFRYWHIDAYIPTANYPIIPPLSLNGIMGGATYRMVRQQPPVA